MAKRVTDPVFGELVWNSRWDGEADVPALGGQVKIGIFVEESDRKSLPTDAQRAAFSAFIARADALRPRIERALFDHYQQVRPIYAEEAWPEFEEGMPVLDRPDQVWALLSGPTIILWHQEPEERTVELGWNCTWDPEHGVDVRIVNEEVVEVE